MGELRTFLDEEDGVTVVEIILILLVLEQHLIDFRRGPA